MAIAVVIISGKLGLTRNSVFMRLNLALEMYNFHDISDKLFFKRKSCLFFLGSDQSHDAQNVLFCYNKIQTLCEIS